MGLSWKKGLEELNKSSTSSRVTPFKLFDNIRSFLRRFLFQVLSYGPMPRHIAFILDGNRRYGKKWSLKQGTGHRIGFSTLIYILRYCYEMGVKYVTMYAFSIDNFKRDQSEVQFLMDLIHEEMEAVLGELPAINALGARFEFLGDLNLLDKTMRDMTEKVKEATVGNTKLVLFICIAYTSSNEIVNAVQGSCAEKWADVHGSSGVDFQGVDDSSEEKLVSLGDLERNMFLAGCPDPDILIRTSGETRLSNFLLWQTTNCLLYAPRCLWPEISLRHLVWAVLKYQHIHPYLDKEKKKKLKTSFTR